ncbi:DNA primase [Butyricicoccus sp. AM29-23AC]|nr:DNA primase [Butyricicoccus sp. AM29-23AC]
MRCAIWPTGQAYRCPSRARRSAAPRGTATACMPCAGTPHGFTTIRCGGRKTARRSSISSAAPVAAHDEPVRSRLCARLVSCTHGRDDGEGVYARRAARRGPVSRSEKGRIYDRFRNRVMFPIIDVRGNVIAFGGRVMDDSKPKYLNSPETPIFHKSRNLFALNLSKTTKNDYFILAEGYMDVIALHQAGFDSAVASLGTSLTEEQARIIARHTERIVISYDADGAGQSAAQRAIDILKKCDLQVKVLRIPGAKDPDEFIKARGAAAFRALIERSEDHNAFRIEQIAAKYDLEDDEARVLFLKDAARMLAGIESSIEREVYAGRAAKMAGVTPEAMAVEVRRELGIQRKRRRAAERREIRSPVGLAQPKDRTLAYADVKSAKAEENVLRLLFTDQKLIHGMEEQLPAAWFSAPVLRKIYERVLELDRSGSLVDALAFEGQLETGEMSLLAGILEQGVPPGDHRAELREYINTIRLQRVKDGTLTQAGEDPLLTFGRMKNQNAGGQTI